MSTESRSVSPQMKAVDRAREALRTAREAVADAERALGGVSVEGQPRTPERSAETVEVPWRERLWSAPAECRIGMEEVTAALGVSPSWVYRRTTADAEPRLPHAKLGGSLVFKCGEVRAWLRDHEEVEVAYRMDSAPAELRLEGRTW